MISRIEGKKVVGFKQTQKHLKNGEGKKLYLAKEADSILIEPIKQVAEQQGIEIIYVETLSELGKLCGIDVGAAAALVL